MLRNYFITAFRHIIKNKIQSFIQVISLTIGITALILIGIYSDNELRYDKFNEKRDRIYRLEYGDLVSQQSAIGNEIIENLTEIENVVRINISTRAPLTKSVKYISDLGKTSEREIELKTKSFYCDSTVFDVFTFPFIQGDPKTALRDPFSVVLTEGTARKIFGSKDPVGEVIEIDRIEPRNKSYTVTGVIHDVENFHIDFDMLLSLVSLREEDDIIPLASGEKELYAYRHAARYFTYLLLPAHHDITRTETNINAFFKDKMRYTFRYEEGSVFSLRPLNEIYFSPPLSHEWGYRMYGNLKLVRILLAIAVFILVLACINYINMTTARALLRAREVGVRKVAGSLKSRLIAQFLVESVIISLLSFLIAIILVLVLLPAFNQLAMTELSLKRLFQPQSIWLSFACIIFLGIIAGIYPATYLTTFQPVASLKGEQLTGMRSVLFRRILLTFQFAISLVLITGVLTILRQLKYMKTADLGFDKELIVNIPAGGMFNDSQKRQFFKEKILQNPNIKKVAFGPAPGIPGSVRPAFEYDGREIVTYRGYVDPDYFNLFDIKLLQGRNFSWDLRADYWPPWGANMTHARFIANETLVRELGLKSPVGTIFGNENEFHWLLIGVVEDYHNVSLHHIIEPYIYIWYSSLDGVSIKILPNDIQGTIRFIQKEYESIFMDITFEYSFLDETFDRQYENDERLFKIISNFTIVAILISCLGLFGLSSFMAARRTKEIGIRKAMGATAWIVFLLLSKEFVKWIVLSVIIACPIAWIIMDRWLQNFAYRTNISWRIFALTIVIAFAIAFLTVAWQSLKTARTNPVDALRYE
jgi:putative ABC transport system permease protein